MQQYYQIKTFQTMNAAKQRSGWVFVVMVLGLAHAASAANGQVHRRPTHPTVLGSCPLPGFCYRTLQGSQALSNNLSGMPSDLDLAKYKVAVQDYIQSDQFKVGLVCFRPW
jgi:hypothetical protein